MGGGDGAEKTEEPTPKKRQEARKKGTVAKSVELTGAATLLAVTVLAPALIQGLGASIWMGIAKHVSAPPTTIDAITAGKYFWAIAGPATLAAIPLLLAITAVGLGTQFAQVGFLVSTEAMTPKFEKVNPFAGFKRMFSGRALMEGAKATAKMLIFGWVVYSAITTDWGVVLHLSEVTPTQASVEAGKIMLGMMNKIAMIWLVLAAVDYFYQKKSVDKQLKMTKQELKQEMKDQEGSPEIKQQIHKRRQKIMKGGLAKKVREADVLITNPTHFAIAIKYDRSEMYAPIVLAKGVDLVAFRMREFANEAKVPIVENKPLARAIYRQCEEGDFIPRELFGAVAEVLAYVYRQAKRSR